MPEIIDLSQEIYTGMPVFKGLPEVNISMHASHEQWAGIETDSPTPVVNKLELGEHTGTHVDAISHMAAKHKEQSIDTMSLSTFYTEGICLDFSHKNLRELIEPVEMQEACEKANAQIKKGDTVLMHTDHYRKNYNNQDWRNGPGISDASARWLGNLEIAAFGVETMSPGVSGISNKAVHITCGEMGFTHYENMINLDALIGRGRFRFIGLPLKIRGGTGSPVRAVAIFED